jgi:murein DD-endopeptidase MepM/ murein hydrolase activator NlpD
MLSSLLFLLPLEVLAGEMPLGARMVTSEQRKGYVAVATGLYPVYTGRRVCPALTSLFASWIDLDGSRRDEAHTGVDGGEAGDTIVAPASGVVKATWNTDLGWGTEAALLIEHSREDLNLGTGLPVYYSEFNHMRPQDVKRLPEGTRIERGQPLGTVWYPGGDKRYAPEVHWEIWEIHNPGRTRWRNNSHGGRYWVNYTGRLRDPLDMLSRHSPPDKHGGVQIEPYDPEADYRQYNGFTYILQCNYR